MEWISVENGLPEMGKSVIVFLDNCVITIAYRTKSTGNTNYSRKYSWQLFGDMKSIFDMHDGTQITHWMPLPEPPKQK